MDVVWGIVRRNWLLLVLAAIASGVTAWFFSSAYSQTVVTAHLTLSSQQLPGVRQDVYLVPNPNVASASLTSVKVLQPVADRHGLSMSGMSRLITVKPNLLKSTIDVELVLDDRTKAMQILDDVGNEFVKLITEQRIETLTKHARYISELLLKAVNELGTSRTELAKLEDSLRLSGKGDLQKSAELQGIVNRQTQLETSLALSLRQQTRIQRDQNFLLKEFNEVQAEAFRDVLDGRRRQAENLGRGLTAAARISSVKAEIEEQLSALDAELEKLHPESEVVNAVPETAAADPASKETPASDVSVATPSSEVPTAASSDVPTAPSSSIQTVSLESSSTEAAVPRTPASADPAASKDELSDWIEKVLNVGEDTLGDLAPETMAQLQSAQSRLSEMTTESRRLQLEAEDNRLDAEEFTAKLKEVEAMMKRTTTAEFNLTSAAVTELQLDVAQKELKYSRLLQQLEQINQVKDCQLSEYIVSSAAVVNPALDYMSDKKTLFAFAFLGCGVLLTAPLVLLEAARLRPSPVNIISQRWNLPVLGVQASLSLKGRQTGGASEDHQELRLMALRIQQSLFRPKGRVVLFSGLDHEESPITLIRSLANCLCQREETVLIVQTLPGQLDDATKKLNNETFQRTGRPGVAEFLAGEFDDAHELIIGTGIQGVDFLPGGSIVAASEAMASSRLTTLIDQFRESYSMIILCGPSTLHPADLQMLAARADGIVFTVNKKSVRAVYGNEVIGDLIELGAPILGFAEQPFSAKKAFPGNMDANSDITLTTAISV